MRKIVVLLFMAVFVSGCATLDYLFTEQTQPAKSVWPSPNYYTKGYWYRPGILSSAEEAMGTLKNLQESFVGASKGTFGKHFKTFDLDKYGLRAKWEWTEAVQHSQYVPNSGGYFVGLNYVPYYGGSYQTHTDTSQYEGAFVIPFAMVASLGLFNYPLADPSCPFPWQLMVRLDDGNTVDLRVTNEKTAKLLGNAIATLSKEQGRIISSMVYGFTVFPLKQEQSAELALQSGTGLLIYDVYVGSPAEKIGLRFLDIILEVDGQSVKDPNELTTLAKNKKSVNLKILRWEKITDATGKASLQKTELFFPLNLE
ncbi:MAG: PDZ domain-containing protein [Candidatus Omnitrophica bacterium]|nr:PDZ domain-containing protein [Candidatus Omnitrophota bacterium]MDD5352854.1 PDZ domain-containing protein [Candidatus Omnitrophota bacterium]MDD5550453.1 PDZ domain-containing protein [Candidatus Omnitrophota bacterium]